MLILMNMEIVVESLFDIANEQDGNYEQPCVVGI